MVCLICDDYFHETANCDQAINDEARKKLLKEKEFCQFCFGKSAMIHLSKEKCKSNNNCFEWFSTEHHTVFCPKRVSQVKPNILPKIDNELLPRFLQIMNIEDKYLTVLSSPKYFQMFPLNPITVVDLMQQKHVKNYSNSSTVVVRRNMLLNSDRIPRFFTLLYYRKIICNARVLNIRCIKLSDQELWLLLSSYTKIFDIYKTTITPAVTFSKCLSKMPNLEECSMNETNIEVENSWLDDLLKLENLNSFNLLKLTIERIDFDINKLVEFITKNCLKNATTDLTFVTYARQYANVKEVKKELMKKISSHFVEKPAKATMSTTGLFINIMEINADRSKKISCHGGFVLK